MRPLPARKAKLSLVEAMRDLAEADRAFAALAGPVLVEFMGSRPQREGGAQTLVGEVGRHPDVGQDEVRTMGIDRREELGQAGRRGHDVDVVIGLEQRKHAGSEQVAVFGQDETAAGRAAGAAAVAAAPS